VYSKDYSMIAYGGAKASNITEIVIVDSNLNFVKAITTNFSAISRLDFSYDDTRILACGYNHYSRKTVFNNATNTSSNVTYTMNMARIFRLSDGALLHQITDYTK